MRSLCVFLASLVMGSLHAQGPAARVADAYPNRAIRMVVGYPPGSGVDLVPRFVGERLLAKWGHPLVVENRPGASGHIATEIVAKAAPDGYTLLTVPPAFATTPHMFATLPFDSDAMVPVSVMVSQANVLVVHPARLSEVRTFQNLIETAKARPGQLNYGSSGNGGSHHLSMELLKMLTGVQVTHVPYKGAAVVSGFLSGDVDTGFFTLGGLLPHIKSGKLRALAVGGDRRNAALLEVPTLGELLPGMVSATWFAMIAPPKTPPEVIAKLNAAVVEALQHPEVQKRLTDLHADVIGNSPEQAAAFISEENARWGKVIRAANIKAD
jgi:tripartite-type tricarboxylate transporter receptor subunit TctC